MVTLTGCCMTWMLLICFALMIRSSYKRCGFYQNPISPSQFLMVTLSGHVPALSLRVWRGMVVGLLFCSTQRSKYTGAKNRAALSVWYFIWRTWPLSSYTYLHLVPWILGPWRWDTGMGTRRQKCPRDYGYITISPRSPNVPVAEPDGEVRGYQNISLAHQAGR